MRYTSRGSGCHRAETHLAGVVYMFFLLTSSSLLNDLLVIYPFQIGCV